MSRFRLSERIKKNISSSVGAPFERIVTLSLDEEICLASQKHGGKIVFSKKRNGNRVGRGNPLLARKKVRTIQDIEKKIAKVK
jgi:hypothetical protein